MNQGIYRIFGKTGKSYIGKSVDISRRLYSHKYEMRTGRHKNSHMQNSYDKYGEDFFTFEILELVENVDDMPEREQFYIDAFDSYKNGYNMSMAVSNRDTWAVTKGSRPVTSAKVKLWWSEGTHKQEQSQRVKSRFAENPDARIKLVARSTCHLQVEVFKERMRVWRESQTKEEVSARAKKAQANWSAETRALSEIRMRVAKAKRWLEDKLPKHNKMGFKNIMFMSHVYKGNITTYAVCKYVDNDGKNVSKKFSVSKLGLLPAMAEACRWRDLMMTPMYEQFIFEKGDL